MATYQAKFVSIVVGSLVITGFGENDMVEITRNSDSSIIKKGAKGETSRSLTHDKSGEIKLFLQQDSPANKLLKTLLNLDELTGVGLGTAMVNDLNSGDSYVGTEEVSIKKFADEKKGKELNELEWTIQCGSLDYK